MKKHQIALILGLLLAFESFLFAQEGVPFTHVVTSRDCDRFFVMDKDESGACYLAKKAEQLKVLWTTEGWFGPPELLFLGHEGRILVRVFTTLWTEDYAKPIAERRLVEFYRNGKSFRVYRVKDLLDTQKKIDKVQMGHDYEDIFFGGRLGFGKIRRSELRKHIPEEALLSLPSRGGATADNFFFIETAQNEQIVFALRGAREGGILYRGKRVKEDEADIQPHSNK